MRESTRWAWRLLFLELALWLGPVVAFLALYTLWFGAPTRAWVSHVEKVALLWLALAGIRLLAGAPSRPLAWTVAILCASGWLLLLAYQGLVLVGLDAWGRVVSWVLIETYIEQADDLLQTLGTSTPAAGIGLATFLGMLALGMRWLLASDALVSVGRHLELRMRRAVAIAVLGVVAIRTWGHVEFPQPAQGDPISLTFFNHHSSSAMQSHRISGPPHRLGPPTAYQPDGPAKSPHNVILIVVDALRADRLPPVSSDRQTHSRLAARLAQGEFPIRTSISAVCAESSCGLMALARSRYLHEFTDKDISLTHALKLHGYRIEMLLSGDHTNFYGLREAYGAVDEYFDGSMAKGYYMNDDQFILDRLAQRPKWRGQPTFLQIHLMSTHALGRLGEKREEVFNPSINYSRPGWRPRTVEAIRHATNFYDNGMLETDQAIDQALKTLADKGFLDNAVVLITGDHGELLGEKGLYSHSKSVWEPVLRVPLWIGLYGNAHRETVAVSDHASQIDVAPTVADLVGIVPPPTWNGSSLISGFAQRPYTFFQQGHEVGLYDATKKGRTLKHSYDTRSRIARVFDISNDAHENTNIIENIPIQQRVQWRHALGPSLAALAGR